MKQGEKQQEQKSWEVPTLYVRGKGGRYHALPKKLVTVVVAWHGEVGSGVSISLGGNLGAVDGEMIMDGVSRGLEDFLLKRRRVVDSVVNMRRLLQQRQEAHRNALRALRAVGRGLELYRALRRVDGHGCPEAGVPARSYSAAEFLAADQAIELWESQQASAVDDHRTSTAGMRFAMKRRRKGMVNKTHHDKADATPDAAHARGGGGA